VTPLAVIQMLRALIESCTTYSQKTLRLGVCKQNRRKQNTRRVVARLVLPDKSIYSMLHITRRVVAYHTVYTILFMYTSRVVAIGVSPMTHVTPTNETRMRGIPEPCHTNQTPLEYTHKEKT